MSVQCQNPRLNRPESQYTEKIDYCQKEHKPAPCQEQEHGREQVLAVKCENYQMTSVRLAY